MILSGDEEEAYYEEVLEKLNNRTIRAYTNGGPYVAEGYRCPFEAGLLGSAFVPNFY